MPAPDVCFMNTEMSNNSPTGFLPTNAGNSTWQTNGLGGITSMMSFTGGTAGTQDSVEFDITDQGATPASSGWISFLWGSSGFFIEDARVFCIISGPTEDILRLIGDTTGGNNQWKFQYYNGTTWTDIGAAITTPDLGLFFKIDIFYDIDVTGEFSLYIDGSGTALRTFTGDTNVNTDTTLQKISFYAADPTTTNDPNYISAVIWDSGDTRDLYGYEFITAGNGTLNNWDSAVETSIDNSFANWYLSLSLAISTSGANDDVTFNMQGLGTEVTGKTIEGVSQFWHFKAAGANPFYIKALAYISSTKYTNAAPGERPADLTGAEWDYVRVDWDVDPSTGVAWASDTAVEAAEFGFETRTSA